MNHRELSEQTIISGFRKGDANIIREYFYGYCQAGYYIFDQRYQLSEKENLDFMSLAHQYAIYLMEHDWKPLEDHSPNVSLKTWLINGFRYVVLDALKWYKKEYIAWLQGKRDCSSNGYDSIGHLAEIQETEGRNHHTVFQEEFRHGLGYGGGDGRKATGR